MARMLRLKPILTAYLTLSVLWVPTNYVKADQISEKLKRELQWEEHYFLSPEQEPEAWTKKLIRSLNTELKRSPVNPEQIQLFLGDAYHWLGHVLEEKGRLEESFVAHKKSREHYTLANALYSPAINFYWPEGHANFHLTKLAEKLQFAVEPSWKNGWHQKHETQYETELRESYMTQLRATVESVERSMLMVQPGEEFEECESVFVNIPE